MTYLWLKAFHLIFMVSWFAGLFYLPRIFVNLAMTRSDKKDETYEHLLIMAQKLYRFVSPFMVITILLGGWMLYLNPELLHAFWMQIKLGLVSILVIYHLICGNNLQRFINKKTTRSHIYYRYFNEFPVIILLLIVLLAVLKP